MMPLHELIRTCLDLNLFKALVSVDINCQQKLNVSALLLE